MSWSADMHKSVLILEADYFEIWLTDMILI